MSTLQRFARAGLFAVAAVVLSSCARLHTASMRVEVEVYKGPLSKTPQVQWGELEGLLKNINVAFTFFHRAVGKSKDYEACRRAGLEPLYKMPECAPLDEMSDASVTYRDITHKILDEIARLNAAGGLEIPSHCDEEANKTGCTLTLNKIRKQLTSISSLAMSLKTQAIRDAFFQNSWRPKDPTLRTAATNYVNLLSESSNQLASRADALIKQLEGVEARQLAQSVFLRDSAPTSQVNMYVWDWAMAEALPQDRDNVRDERYSRVRAIERHFSDYYWSNINTVFATGHGDVGMALVKDDIGNWNLKNFTNDPSEILDTYKKAGLALVQTAVKLAADTSTGGATALPQAQRVLNFANHLTLGPSEDGGASLDTFSTSLHAQAEQQIRTVIAETERDKEVLDNAINKEAAQLNDDASITAAINEHARKREEKKECDSNPNDQQATFANDATVIAARVRDAAKADGAASSRTMTTAAQNANDALTKARKARTADAAKDCNDALGALAQAEVAARLLQLAQNEAKLKGLPAVAKARIVAVLDAHQRSIAELSRADAAHRAESIQKEAANPTQRAASVPAAQPASFLPSTPAGSLLGSKP